MFEREPEVESRLLKLDNVVVIPHLGSATIDTRIAMGNVVADNVFAALDGERAPRRCSTPTRSGHERMTGRGGASSGRRERPSSDTLRRDVRLLTTMLGDAIAESGGAELLADVETLRRGHDLLPRAGPRPAGGGGSWRWSTASTWPGLKT